MSDRIEDLLPPSALSFFLGKAVGKIANELWMMSPPIIPSVFIHGGSTSDEDRCIFAAVTINPACWTRWDVDTMAAKAKSALAEVGLSLDVICVVGTYLREGLVYNWQFPCAEFTDLDGDAFCRGLNEEAYGVKVLFYE